MKVKDSALSWPEFQQLRKQKYIWPGGYALIFIMDDGEYLCNTCVQEPEVHIGGQADGWRVEGYTHTGERDIEPYEVCAHCGAFLVP